MRKPSFRMDLHGSMFVTFAEAHCLALEKIEAGGERIIICKGRVVWQDWSKFSFLSFFPPFIIHSISSWCLLSLFPQSMQYERLTLKYSRRSQTQMCWNMARDDGAANGERVYQVDYDTSKAKKIFGIEFRTEKDSATDMIAEFGKRGW